MRCQRGPLVRGRYEVRVAGGSCRASAAPAQAIVANMGQSLRSADITRIDRQLFCVLSGEEEDLAAPGNARLHHVNNPQPE